MSQVSIRALQEADLRTLHDWMNEPHLRPFYMFENISIKEVVFKFRPRINGDSVEKCLIAEFEGVPFGYVQWYYNRSFPDYGVATKGYNYGVSLDYFIGNPGFLGRALGYKMLKAVIKDISSNIQVRDHSFFLIHNNKNHSAIRCSHKAAFVWIDSMIYNDKQSGIYHRIL